MAFDNKNVPAEWLDDTEPKAREVYLNIHRRMSPGQRLAHVFELCDFLQALQLANIRASYPEADDREVFLRLAARRLPRDLMIKAYNWDPNLHH